jgi:hypothetical protein
MKSAHILGQIDEMKKPLFRGRDILLGQRGALTEEVLFHLANDGFLILSARGIQTIFIEQHFAVFGPHLPGLPGDAFIDFLPQFGVERRLIQAWKFLMQLGAKNCVLAHDFLVKEGPGNYLTAKRFFPTSA